MNDCINDCEEVQTHPFLEQPNKTLVGLAIPVLFSLVAEPLTGLADTAFIARLHGAEPVAALGVGTVAFSSIFWIFSFLGIGTQTEIAKSMGRHAQVHASKIASLAATLSIAIGGVLVLIALPYLTLITSIFGAEGLVNQLACEYMYYRLLGIPFVLLSIACFGALRGVQDMRTPLLIAVGVNLLNLLLDWLLIDGIGPFPALGVAGAAIASTLSQIIGGCWGLGVVAHRLGLTWKLRGAGIDKLLSIGGDLFIRTGMVLLFFGFCTRVANQSGANEGAAYQAIRQFFIFATLSLDAFAIVGQSLVGYFYGAGENLLARRVALYVCSWSVGTGILMCLIMLVGESLVVWLLVPDAAFHVFRTAWFIAALAQPVGSLSFATDGLHWGTGDFRYLRNVMILATLTGIGIVFLLRLYAVEHTLVIIWGATIVWTSIRAGFGLVRIWPGIGHAPLRSGSSYTLSSQQDR